MEMYGNKIRHCRPVIQLHLTMPSKKKFVLQILIYENIKLYSQRHLKQLSRLYRKLWHKYHIHLKINKTYHLYISVDTMPFACWVERYNADF